MKGAAGRRTRPGLAATDHSTKRHRDSRDREIRLLQENDIAGVERFRPEMATVVVPTPPGGRLLNVTGMAQWGR
jgi:hypothetical protein